MNIKVNNKLKAKLLRLEQTPGADKALIKELQDLIYGTGWHTVP